MILRVGASSRELVSEKDALQRMSVHRLSPASRVVREAVPDTYKRAAPRSCLTTLGAPG